MPAAARVEAMVRWCLREFGWCQLVGERFYVHFGYDYDMYIGADELADDARQQIAADGLFVEMCESPYQRRTPTAFMVLAARIGEKTVDHERPLPKLPEGADPDVAGRGGACRAGRGAVASIAPPGDPGESPERRG